MPEPDDFSETPSTNEILGNALELIYEENPELALCVKEELDAAARGDENILLVGTDGEYSVTIVHVDPEFLGENQKMMLLPTSSSISVLVAVSRAFLEEKVMMCETLESDGEIEVADKMWDDLMGSLLQEAVEIHKKNPQVF